MLSAAACLTRLHPHAWSHSLLAVCRSWAQSLPVSSSASFTNRFGPRYAMGFLLILSSSAVFGMALVRENTSFIIVRCMIGFALASFVPCQFWTSVLFTAPLVGSANAVAGGWGNLGEPPAPVRLQPGDGQVHVLGTFNVDGV